MNAGHNPFFFFFLQICSQFISFYRKLCFIFLHKLSFKIQFTATSETLKCFNLFTENAIFCQKIVALTVQIMN